jgi:Fe-S cluster assembly ATP-binding protein
LRSGQGAAGQKSAPNEKEKNELMLEIRNLHVAANGTKILSGINLKVNAGEVHAIMGPNGSGKSTLSQVLAGHPAYTVLEGEVLFEGKNLLEMQPEVRAREGVFLAFQYPVEIPGVMNFHFLHTALNEIRKHKGLEEMDAMDFDQYLKEKAQILHMDMSLLNRRLNEGFSGGEKKRNEILQMSVLEPKLAILDETDSGLDIDALKTVASGINQLRRPENAIILVTHYQRILNHVLPDFVHVLFNGKIVKSGGKDLALELEAKGYDWLKEDAVHSS